MDFEFNQSDGSTNGKTPNRTDGDLLIEYKLSKGGTVPELYRYTWIDGSGALTVSACEASSIPCWGDKTSLSLSGDAAGSINTSPISGALGPLDPYTFGEASVDLKSIFDSNKCKSFGSAYLKSRSSDSFTSAIKDFIVPQTVKIGNCGTVIIRKNTLPSGATDSSGAPLSFGFTSNISTYPGTDSSFPVMGGSSKKIENVLAGESYWVEEDDPGRLGWELTNIDCGGSVSSENIDVLARRITFDINVGETVTCTFTNTKRGQIIVRMETIPSGDPQSFTFTPSYGFDFNLTDYNPETTSPQNESGFLAPGPYAVSQAVPEGWDPTSDTCDGIANTPGNINLQPGKTVTCTFTNTKRGKIIVREVTIPSGDPQSFTFTRSYGADFNLTDYNPETTSPQNESGFLEHGLFSVSETVPPGWELTSIICNDAESSGNTTTATATVNVDPGETVRCVFTNTKLFTIITLVCDADQLYLSTVAMGDGTPVQTLGLTAQDSTSYNPCSLAGARFENMSTGPHHITVSIPPLSP